MPICKKDSKSSYKGNEPSPKGLGYCAHSENVDTKMKGKDGNMWIIKKTSTGSKRWVKLSSNTKVEKKGKKYYVHDNGGRPFEVVVNKNDVSIYKRDENDDNENYEKIPFSILIKKIKAKKVIIGTDKSMGKSGIGNSILLEMGKNKYICITDNIFEFELENGDEFVKYFSHVGNSDVPYPVLLGKNYFYSMVDKTRGSLKYFPENYKIDDYELGHDFYYGTFQKKKGWVTEVKDIQKLKKYKEIEKRFY
jgi:hypothetical protein